MACSKFKLFTCLALSGLMHSFVHATTVYKTVDENGVVSFSDTAPASSEPVETLSIDVSEPQLSETEQQRLEDMRNSTDRMVADRMAREKHRAEMRKLQAEQAAAEVEYYPYQQPSYSSSYYPTSVVSRHSRRDNRFGVRYRDDNWGVYYGNRPPRPEHPIARPPLKPGHGHHPGHNYRSTPQRPVYNEYPASTVRKGYDPRVRRVIETGHYPSRRK